MSGRFETDSKVVSRQSKLVALDEALGYARADWDEVRC